MAIQKKALLILPFLFVFFVSCHSNTQWTFALSLTSALSILGISGHILYQLILQEKSALFEFTFLKIALAQVFFLISFFIVNPLLTVLSLATGWQWGGSVTFFSLFIAFILCARKKHKKIEGATNDDAPHFFHYLMAIVIFGVIAKVASFYSFSAGALGSDTHQHIYWTNHIVDYGYLPLAARGTHIVELYAKGLHVLTALWTSLGFQQLTGPFLKMMPFIQGILPVAIAIEVLTRREKSFSVKALALAGVIGFSIVSLTFYCLRLYYPNLDLNSTGRLAGAVTTVLPVILAFASQFAPNRNKRFSFLVLFLVPVLGAFSTAMNPSLIVAYLLFTCPLTLILIAPSFSSVRWTKWVFSLALGFAVSAIIVVQDPYLLSFLNKTEKGRLIEDVLASITITTDEEATAQGLKTDVEFQVRKAAEADVCQDQECYLERLQKEFETTPWTDIPTLIKLGAFSPHSFLSGRSSQTYYWILWGLLSALFLATMSRSIKERQLALDGVKALALTGLIFAFLFVQQLAANHLRAAVANDNISFVLLQQYATSYVNFLSMPLAAIILIVAVIGTWHLTIAKNFEMKDLPWRRLALVGFSLGALVAIALRQVHSQELDPAKGFWTPVTRQEIHAFRQLEKMISPTDVVAVPAQYFQMGNEHWIFPQGEVTKYLPFGRNSYIFNIRLGAGYRYDWRDFRNKFCSTTPSVRRDFITQQNIKWLLIAGSDVASESFFNNSSVCEIFLKDFGAVFPTAFVKGGKIAYFRLDPTLIR